MEQYLIELFRGMLKERYAQDGGTSEGARKGWQTRRLRGTIAKSAATSEEAVSHLKTLAGKDLVNDDSGIVARINAVQRNKMVSGEAVAKSIKNGFGYGEHMAAVSKMESIWKNALLLGTRKDANGDPNIRSIKRFGSPILIGNKPGCAYLTAKESEEHGHRVYSIELEKIETLEGNLKKEFPSSASSVSKVDDLKHSRERLIAINRKNYTTTADSESRGYKC